MSKATTSLTKTSAFILSTYPLFYPQELRAAHKLWSTLINSGLDLCLWIVYSILTESKMLTNTLIEKKKQSLTCWINIMPASLEKKKENLALNVLLFVLLNKKEILTN